MEERGPGMQEQSGSTEGRRLAAKQGQGKKARTAIIAAAAAGVLLVGGYLGLCAYAAGDRVLPGTYMGDVPLGGLTVDEAREKIGEAARDLYDAMEIPIQVGEQTVDFEVREAGVSFDTANTAEAVRADKGGFLAGGWKLLTRWFGKTSQLRCEVNVSDADYIAKTLDKVAAAVSKRVEDPHWEIDEAAGEAVLYRGRTGQSIDREAVYRDLMAALERQGGAVTAEVTTTPPAQPDFDAMKAEIDREPVDATLDVETDEIIPHQNGLTFDPAQAKAAFSGLEEGRSVRVPLELAEPEITTLKLRAGLFRDLLGEGVSKITGDANRVGNVKLAAAACNGKILLPGEQMSYNKTTGQRTEAKGYRKASGYTAKGIEDMVGGGVCQPSSTLYLACLNADLEIVERSNHRYTVSYMPEGMDATVSWPNLDYVFANNTPYPIKVVTNSDKNVLTVRIYGTKTDTSYVKMESVRLSTTPAGVKYEADETIPQGTTKVLQAAHTGKKVQVYKNIYNGDGSLRERILISTDTYRPGDKIVGYNPADGAPDGSVPPTEDPGPVTGQPLDPAGEGETPVPEQPEQPSQPEQPEQPETPAEPVQPEQPAQPEVPPQPVESEPGPVDPGLGIPA